MIYYALREKAFQERMKEGRSLYLLMNANYSYQEGNPVFQRAINTGLPFLCWPAMIWNSEAEAFQSLEYRSLSELNEKIEKASDLYLTQKMEVSRNEYQERSLSFYKSDLKFLEVLVKGDLRTGPSEFDIYTSADREKFQVRLSEFLNEFGEKVQYLYEAFTSKNVVFDLGSSRFAQGL